MAKQGKVTIVQDEMGNTIRVSKNNPEYGHVVLSQEDSMFTQTGWIKKVTKSTLLHGTVEDLRDEKQLKNKTLQGSIYIVESFKPFSTDNPDYDLKMAGSTGIICKGTDTETGEMNMPIYRKSYYDPTGTMVDTLVPHTNSQEIREANSFETVSRLKANVETKEEVDPNQMDLEDVIEEVTNEVEETEDEIVEETSNEEVLVEEEEVSFNL
jgi:hypothetical protein